MDPKQRVAEAALKFLASDMVVGLGTGSTADFFLRALGEAIKSKRLKNIRGVPTSRRSEQRANELGIPLLSMAQHPHVDITIDGADEVSPTLDLIKGLGGALLREKIIAQNSRQLVIIADAGKKVSHLGEKGPLPVEVTVFGHELHEDFLRSLKAKPALRKNPNGSPFITDNGNYIFDCRFQKIDDPHALEQSLKSRAGVVETGLFLGMAGVVLIGTSNEIERLTRA